MSPEHIFKCVWSLILVSLNCKGQRWGVVKVSPLWIRVFLWGSFHGVISYLMSFSFSSWNKRESSGRTMTISIRGTRGERIWNAPRLISHGKLMNLAFRQKLWALIIKTSLGTTLHWVLLYGRLFFRKLTTSKMLPARGLAQSYFYLIKSILSTLVNKIHFIIKLNCAWS